MLSSFSGAMPMPVSETTKWSGYLVPFGREVPTFKVTSPSSVNLIAFPTRFTMIWRSRFGSPRTRSARQNLRRTAIPDPSHPPAMPMCEG